MRSQVIAILLCISCICTMTGCGSRAVSESVEASASPQEAFGNAPVASPELAAQTAQTEMGAAEESEAMPEEREDGAFHQQLAAVILCRQDGLKYDPEDPVYFWRAVGYLVGMTAPNEFTEETEQSGVYRVTQENIQVFVQAIFADFSGQIPSVTEEDPVVSMGENGDYLFHMPAVAVSLTSVELMSGADGDTVRVEAGIDGKPAGTYEIALEDYTGPEIGMRRFSHSIAGVETKS